MLVWLLRTPHKVALNSLLPLSTNNHLNLRSYNKQPQALKRVPVPVPASHIIHERVILLAVLFAMHQHTIWRDPRLLLMPRKLRCEHRLVLQWRCWCRSPCVCMYVGVGSRVCMYVGVGSRVCMYIGVGSRVCMYVAVGSCVYVCCCRKPCVYVYWCRKPCVYVCWCRNPMV